MIQPPAVRPDPRPGPDFDPVDFIVQDLQNIESFLLFLGENLQDRKYLNSHLSAILGIRRNIAQNLRFLAEKPYEYTPERLRKLEKENEQMFSYIEGVAGEMLKGDIVKCKK